MKMIKKLLFSLIIVLITSYTKAQSIGVIGDFNNWNSDVVMNTSDNIVFTLSNQTFLISGGVKFRQDAQWTNSWGSANFPSGIGILGGVNIPVPAGTYDITFNINTGAYSFNVSTNFENFGLYGGFNNWSTPSLPLVTADGVFYSENDYHFIGNGVKFIKDNNLTTTWGSSAFPFGTATSGGPEIPLTSGFYNVEFNKNSLQYNFVQVPVSIIGDAVSNWNTDVDMISTDGGVTFMLQNIPLSAGGLKFRANYSWASNWGSTSFPTGTGNLNGNDNIIVPDFAVGIYDITFNRVTGAYNFAFVAPLPFDTISFNGNVLSTSDGIIYTGFDVYLATQVNTNFVQNNSVTWGINNYPSGTAVLGNTNTISIPAGYYSIFFDKSTGDYSITPSSVSIIGNAASGWNTDINMNSTDNGISFTLPSVVLSLGQVKFRVNQAWITSYGDSAFPSGIAGSPGSNIEVNIAGTYSVNFNRLSGVYNFTNLLTSNQFNNNSFSLAPNPSNGIFAINTDAALVQIFNLTGQLVKTFNNAVANESLSISELNQGVYFVKVTDLNLNEKTIKLIKE
jgi:hypothetical protein